MVDLSRCPALPANDVEPASSAQDRRELRDTRDLHVERALDAMKKDPARRWTVAALARVAGLSRAPFARRFQRTMKTSPLKWLTEYRLELARRRLLESDVGLAWIATEIGYASEFAFSKAFKRLFGIAPGLFRRAPSVPSFRAAA